MTCYLKENHKADVQRDHTDIFHFRLVVVQCLYFRWSREFETFIQHLFFIEMGSFQTGYRYSYGLVPGSISTSVIGTLSHVKSNFLFKKIKKIKDVQLSILRAVQVLSTLNTLLL